MPRKKRRYDMAEVIFKSNKALVSKAFELGVTQALEAIGQTAESYAKDECPVDTGNLRASITHKANESERAVYIGTNVTYGKYQEFGTITGIKPKHFLQMAAQNHSEEYKSLAEAALEAAEI